jgi:hypothetical protein
VSDVQRNAWLRQTLGLPQELHTLLATWPEEALQNQLALLNVALSPENLAKNLLALLNQGRQKLQTMTTTPGAWSTPGNASAGKQASDMLQHLTQLAAQIRQNPLMASQVLTLLTIAWQPAAPFQQVRVDIPTSDGKIAGGEENAEAMHSVQVYMETRHFGRLRFILQEPVTHGSTWQILGYATLSEDAQQKIKTHVNAKLPSSLGKPEWFWMLPSNEGATQAAETQAF